MAIDIVAVAGLFMEVLPFVLVGCLGGLVRALYGLAKAVARGDRIDLWYFFVTLLVAGIFGGVLGSLFDAEHRIIALIGYVGSDVLETFFASVVPKSLVVRR